jgi:hypothetical protein
LESAKRSFEDALNVFMTETLEKGTFFNELESLGWNIKLVPVPEFRKPTKKSKHTSHGEVIDRTQIPVRIPIRA